MWLRQVRFDENRPLLLTIWREKFWCCSRNEVLTGGSYEGMGRKSLSNLYGAVLLLRKTEMENSWGGTWDHKSPSFLPPPSLLASIPLPLSSFFPLSLPHPLRSFFPRWKITTCVCANEYDSEERKKSDALRTYMGPCGTGEI